MAQNFNLPILGTDPLHTAVKTTIPNALEALRTCHSGATEPASMVPFMLWMDTTTGYLKVRNSANTDWILVTYATASPRLTMQATIVPSLSATSTVKLGIAPRAGTLEKLVVVCDTASTSSSGNEWRFSLQKRTNATPGTAVQLFSTNVGTFTALAGVGGAAEFVAHKAYELTPNQNATITELDELEVVLTKLGTATTLTNVIALAWMT